MLKLVQQGDVHERIQLRLDSQFFIFVRKAPMAQLVRHSPPGSILIVLMCEVVDVLMSLWKDTSFFEPNRCVFADHL